jgi:hypothetical protein
MQDIVSIKSLVATWRSFSPNENSKFVFIEGRFYRF